MRCLVQRVKEASVSVSGNVIGAIEKGYLILLGVSQTDTEEVADKMLKKVLDARLFEDENGKTNLSIRDVSGSLLVVSQFTLYADTRRGNRPSFINAGAPDHANTLYEYFCKKAEEQEEQQKKAELYDQMQTKLELMHALMEGKISGEREGWVSAEEAKEMLRRGRDAKDSSL